MKIRTSTSVQEAVSNGKGETVRDLRFFFEDGVVDVGGVCKRDKIQRQIPSFFPLPFSHHFLFPFYGCTEYILYMLLSFGTC